MKLTLQIGAHEIGNGRLVNCLLRNSGLLSEHGIEVPRPSHYRRYLLGVMNAMTSSREADRGLKNEIAVLLPQLRNCENIILADSNFSCLPHRIFENGRLYSNMDKRLGNFARLFPDFEIELNLGMRSMSNFIPALLSCYSSWSYDNFLQDAIPQNLMWSELVDRLRTAMPTARITVWCDEDTPLIWNDVLHQLAGLDTQIPMDGELDVMQEMLPNDGFERLSGFMNRHRPVNERARQRLLEAYLVHFGTVDDLELTVDLPGWDSTLMDQLDANYERDVKRLAGMPNVTLIRP